jgi:hypothetical protein
LLGTSEARRAAPTATPDAAIGLRTIMQSEAFNEQIARRVAGRPVPGEPRLRRPADELPRLDRLWPQVRGNELQAMGQGKCLAIIYLAATAYILANIAFVVVTENFVVVHVDGAPASPAQVAAAG